MGVSILSLQAWTILQSIVYLGAESEAISFTAQCVNSKNEDLIANTYFKIVYAGAERGANLNEEFSFFIIQII